MNRASTGSEKKARTLSDMVLGSRWELIMGFLHKSSQKETCLSEALHQDGSTRK